MTPAETLTPPIREKALRTNDQMLKSGTPDL